MKGTIVNDCTVLGRDGSGKGFLVECNLCSHQFTCSPAAIAEQRVKCIECAKTSTVAQERRDRLKQELELMEGGNEYVTPEEHFQ